MPTTSVPCWAVFVCGTPFETRGRHRRLGEGRQERPTSKRPRQLLKEAGYKGEKVVILDPIEAHLAHAQAVVTAQKLREIGMNVDVQAIDWGTHSARRQIKDPPDGRHRRLEHLPHLGRRPRDEQPAVEHADADALRRKNWFGWPCDEELEKIRLEFPLAPPEKQKEVVDRLQKRFYEVVPYIPAGQFLAPIAYRKNLCGVLDTARLVLWNIEKS